MPILRRSEPTAAASDPASDRGPAFWLVSIDGGLVNVRASWTKDRYGFHAVLKEQETDAWIWQCQHDHARAHHAALCARRRIESRGGTPK